MRHLDKTRRNERVIPHRPKDFEKDWGDVRAEHAKEFFSQDIRSRAGLKLVAQYYGFLDEWTAYDENNPDLDLPTLFFDLMIMKATFANSGRAPLAIDGNPREGMHRTFSNFIKMTGSKLNPTTGKFLPPGTLRWEDFVEMGFMDAPGNNDELPPIEDSLKFHMWESPSHWVNVEFAYFNVPPTVATSKKLTEACQMKSLEISKSKTTSAKRMPLSAAYELIVVPAFNEYIASDFNMKAKPVPPIGDEYRNSDVIFTPNESVALKALEKGGEIKDVFHVVKILSSPESKAYFMAPMDKDTERAFVRQFPCPCTVDGKTKTLYPPLPSCNKSLANCSPEHMNIEQINLCFFLPKVVWMVCQDGFPDGAMEPHESRWYQQAIEYMTSFHLSRYEEGDNRIKTHGCIGKFSELGGSGGSFLGNNALLGGLAYVTQSIVYLFHRETNALEPFMMGNYGRLQGCGRTVASIRDALKAKEKNVRMWMGRCHLFHPSMKNQSVVVQQLG